MRRAITACMLLSGCAGPAGPVLGDWRGTDQAIEGYRDRTTEIILDGRPGDAGGTYHLVSMVPSTDVAMDNRHVDWADSWSRRVLHDPTGSAYTVFHLRNAPPDHLPDYALLDTGGLLPVIDPGHPDTGAAALRTVLLPLPTTAYGYGRP